MKMNVPEIFSAGVTLELTLCHFTTLIIDTCGQFSTGSTFNVTPAACVLP